MDVLKLRREQRIQWIKWGADFFKRAYEAETDSRDEMSDDLEFSWGEQWDDATRRDRERDKRPVMTVDRIGDIVRKAMKGMRTNRPSIKVLPVEDTDDETAEVYTDLIREIEYASGGSAPYLWAAEFAVRMGFGAFEIVTQENDSDVWAQDIRIKRVANPFTCYFDPDSNHPCKGDGVGAIKTRYYSDEQFGKKWPKAEKAPFRDSVKGEEWERWYSDGDIRVAKVWRKVNTKKTLVLLSDGRSVYADDLSEDDAGLDVVKERRVNTYDVYCYVMSANEILEGPTRLATKHIPLIPVYGEEINIRGKVTYRGVVRTAKDPQRMLNYARTTNAEILAQQPKTPYIVGVSQVPKDLREYWAKANSSKLPYLPYDDSKNPQRPQREPPPVTSMGYLQESQVYADDIQRATGVFDPSLGAPSNETSGRAILARQYGADDGFMVFGDNLAASIEQAGRVLIDLIPTVYDTERVVRLRGEDDSQREVPINTPEIGFNTDTQQIEVTTKNDLTRGKYDVRVAVGKGYHTRKLEAADSMIEFLQAFPAAAPFVADLIAGNQDWPQSEEFAERLRAMVPPGVIQEEDEEKQQAQQAQMQMQMQQLMLAMEKEGATIKKLEAETERERAQAERDVAETARAEADAELKLVQAQTTLAEGLRGR